MKGAISLFSCWRKRLLTSDEFRTVTVHIRKYDRNTDVKEHSLDVQLVDDDDDEKAEEEKFKEIKRMT